MRTTRTLAAAPLACLGAFVTALAVATTLGASTTRPADTLYPSIVAFADRAGDAVTSDFQTSFNHSYTHGQDKFEVGFHTVTNDFVLRRTSGSPQRYLTVSFTPIGGGPSGSVQEHAPFINIRGILDIPNGQARNAVAVIDSAAGTFRFTPAWVDTAAYATKVHVLRSGNTWTVTAGSGAPPEPGDVAGLTAVQKNQTVLLGLYHMPFQISIACPTCPQ